MESAASPWDPTKLPPQFSGSRHGILRSSPESYVISPAPPSNPPRLPGVRRILDSYENSLAPPWNWPWNQPHFPRMLRNLPRTSLESELVSSAPPWNPTKSPPHPPGVRHTRPQSSEISPAPPKNSPWNPPHLPGNQRKIRCASLESSKISPAPP